MGSTKTANNTRWGGGKQKSATSVTDLLAKSGYVIKTGFDGQGMIIKNL